MHDIFCQKQTSFSVKILLFPENQINTLEVFFAGERFTIYFPSKENPNRVQNPVRDRFSSFFVGGAIGDQTISIT